MRPRDPDRYDDDIARTLATPRGQLHIGRGGFTLHYENCRRSGYDCDGIKRAAIAAGLPVIDSREAPYDTVARLVVRGPMIAVNTEPAPPPWHGFSYAPLVVVAEAYRRAGADVHNVPELDEAATLRLVEAPAAMAAILEGWLVAVSESPA